MLIKHFAFEIEIFLPSLVLVGIQMLKVKDGKFHLVEKMLF